MKKLLANIIKWCTGIWVLGVPFYARAATLTNKTIFDVEVNESQTEVIKDIKLTAVSELIESAITFLLGLVGAVAILFIIIGAGNYVWGWTPEQKQKGKEKILYAVGGLLVVSLSYIIIHTIISDLL